MATADEISHKVQESLKESPYACTSLQPLTGGTANFVYRGTLASALANGEETIVIKHTEGYVAQHPDFKLTASRCDFEQSILISLEKLAPVINSGFTISTPRLYDFNNATNTQIYSDLPNSTDLKTYCLNHTLSQETCISLGSSLGLWAKQFHTWGAAPSQEKVRETIRNNTAMRDLKYAVNYAQVVSTVSKFPEILTSAKEVFEEVAKDVKEGIERGEGTLIHGDFWTGNILLPNEPLTTTSASPPRELYVIDWELVQIGSIAYDLGQMFAELFELKHFKDIDAGVQLIAGFMQGYGVLDDELAFKVAIHVGVHLIRWGSSVQGWGTQEQVEEVVRIGRNFFVQGWKKNKSSFEGTALQCLFA